MNPSHSTTSGVFCRSCTTLFYVLSRQCYFLQCDYCYLPHPDKVNQSQSRTETIDSNINFVLQPMRCQEQNNEISTCSLAVKTNQYKFWLYKLCLGDPSYSNGTVIIQLFFIANANERLVVTIHTFQSADLHQKHRYYNTLNKINKLNLFYEGSM